MIIYDKTKDVPVILWKNPSLKEGLVKIKEELKKEARKGESMKKKNTTKLYKTLRKLLHHLNKRRDVYGISLFHEIIKELLEEKKQDHIIVDEQINVLEENIKYLKKT